MTFEDQLETAQLRRRLPPPRERRGLRILAGVSLQAIADRCGVSAVSVLRWEAGSRMPKGKNLKTYLELLDRLRQP